MPATKARPFELCALQSDLQGWKLQGEANGNVAFTILLISCSNAYIEGKHTKECGGVGLARVTLMS